VKRDTNEVAAIKRIRKSILAEPDKVDTPTMAEWARWLALTA